MTDRGREYDTSSLEELSFRLALRAFDNTDAPSGVAHALHCTAQRGIAKAARLHNNRQAVGRVPPELLSMIFALLPVKDRIFVLRVCQYWRKVCVDDCMLWVNVEISLPESFVEWQLQLTGSAPLCITTSSYIRGNRRNISLIKQHLDHTDTLEICACGDIVSSLLCLSAPRLRQLRISDELHGILHPDVFTGCVTWPMLRELSIEGIGLPYNVNHSELLALCPSLESLEYDFSEDARNPSFASLITTYVPHLRVVDFTGRTRQLFAILPALRAVQEVHITAVESYSDDDTLLLLPSLLERDVQGSPVKAFITEDEIHFEFETGLRSLHNPSMEDESWILQETTVLRSLTSLVLSTSNFPDGPLPVASALRVLVILHGPLILRRWADHGLAWPTPSLQKICVGVDWRGRDDSIPSVLSILDRRMLGTVLRDVFTFSARRRLQTLRVCNQRLSDAEGEPELVLEDLVENIDVVRDLDWDPWAASLAQS
ncbi:hypothetical protein EXIGLDRAFT_832224 [Exidia glandulosa HHB12029]|uniref:F-box domain-containing protein n=1 Tax=Exidia glandulosa HHB12029 TaxID=1314781 RepID=A0A165LSX8_EXIGL|nr:hypothetical protein EXIGLDRAFT_832224 [Exidia glandulosa HHB12029]